VGGVVGGVGGGGGGGGVVAITFRARTRLVSQHRELKCMVTAPIRDNRVLDDKM